MNAAQLVLLPLLETARAALQAASVTEARRAAEYLSALNDAYAALAGLTLKDLVPLNQVPILPWEYVSDGVATTYWQHGKWTVHAPRGPGKNARLEDPLGRQRYGITVGQLCRSVDIEVSIGELKEHLLQQVLGAALEPVAPPSPPAPPPSPSPPSSAVPPAVPAAPSTPESSGPQELTALLKEMLFELQNLGGMTAGIATTLERLEHQR